MVFSLFLTSTKIEKFLNKHEEGFCLSISGTLLTIIFFVKSKEKVEVLQVVIFLVALDVSNIILGCVQCRLQKVNINNSQRQA